VETKIKENGVKVKGEGEKESQMIKLMRVEETPDKDKNSVFFLSLPPSFSRSVNRIHTGTTIRAQYQPAHNRGEKRAKS